jgi:ABC-type lipoprotein export system ATPase subunit
MAMSVMELIAEINRNGTTIIMVTHDPSLAEMANRNVHILDGRVSDNGADTQMAKQMARHVGDQMAAPTATAATG